MVVLIAFSFLIPALMTLQAARDAQVVASYAAVSTPSPTPMPIAPPRAAPQRITIIGDAFTAGSAVNSGPATTWPAVVAAQLGLPETVIAGAGMGYAIADASGRSFETAAAQVSSHSGVVVVFGSVDDPDDPAAVGAGVQAVIAAIRERAPGAAIILVGPAWAGTDVPDRVVQNQQAEQTVAAAAAMIFVDPLAQGWFSADPSLIGSDGTYPTDAGHAAIAARLLPLIQQSLPAR
ncbi:MAG: SGNH/GDSL hydrolase family protein [Rhodoglobus sp.]